MGAPSKSQVESYTDQIAAIVQEGIDGFSNEALGKTVSSLWDLVDASGDPDVETALGSLANDIDKQSLPEMVRDWMPTLTNRLKLTDWAKALSTLVTSTAGGSHASIRAYLVDKSAKLHPLAGEVFRRALGESIFTSSSVVLGVSNPTYGAINPSRIYTGADGSLADDLTDATSASTADVTLFASDDHTLYVGSTRPFQGIAVALSTLANATITPTFQYWNGSSWATLTVTDNTSGFTKNDIILFTAPGDWTRYYKDSGGTAFADLARLYYVRIARTANTLATPPVGTCVTIIPTVALAASSGTTHAAIDQPPLAICRITAANTLVVTLPTTVDYTRFAEPVSSESKLRLRALTPIAQNLTVTLDYVDEGAANGSAAQSSWSAPAALGTKTLALTDSADGLRSIRTSTSVSTTATEGVFVVEALPIRSPAS